MFEKSLIQFLFEFPGYSILNQAAGVSMSWFLGGMQ